MDILWSLMVVTSFGKHSLDLDRGIPPYGAFNVYFSLLSYLSINLAFHASCETNIIFIWRLRGVSFVVNLWLTYLAHITHFSKWFSDFFKKILVTWSILTNLILMGLSSALIKFFSCSLESWDVDLTMEINLDLYQSLHILIVKIWLFIILFRPSTCFCKSKLFYLF